MISVYASKLQKGEWLRGRGWDKQHWGLERFPDRWMLDRAVSTNPAALSSRDGHLVWVNSAALAELDLDRVGIEVDPPGSSRRRRPASSSAGWIVQIPGTPILR
jgi:predicted amidohydrolase YtcJ